MDKVFGFAHISYIVAMMVVMVIGLIIIKKHCNSERSKKNAIYFVACFLLLGIIANRISSAVVGENWLSLIPSTVCGITSLLFSASVLLFKNKNHHVFHFLVYIALVGGIIVTFMPDFITQADSIWHSRTITGLFHHTVSAYLAILLIVLGAFKPSIKLWYCLPLGYCVYMVYGLILIDLAIAGNAMNIKSPLLENAPSTWYFLGLWLFVLQFVGVFVFDIVRSKRQVKDVIEKLKSSQVSQIKND